MPISKGTTEKLIETIAYLSEAVGKLNEKLSKPEMVLESKEQPTTAHEFESSHPVPVEYRQAVDTILNKDFTISILPLSDSPAFQFHIIVPPKYSNASAEYIKMYKGDMRPKVITYSEGLIGVRNWCELVYNSFNPTIQAQIVADRNK